VKAPAWRISTAKEYSKVPGSRSASAWRFEKESALAKVLASSSVRARDSALATETERSMVSASRS
jgi:hypothetical protein